MQRSAFWNSFPHPMRIAIYWGLLLLVGCNSVPKHDLAELSNPPSLEISKEAALASGSFAAGSWPSPQWWEMFDDPQLSSLIVRAIENNPTLKKAQAKVETAKELAKRERSLLFPQLAADGDIDWQYFSANGFERSFFPVPKGGEPIPASTNQIDLSLNFTYEFDFWGKNRKRYQAALGQARAEQADAAQARLLIATLVAQAYFDLQTQFAKKKVLEETLQKRIDQLGLTVFREDAGIDNRLQSLQADQRTLQIEKALIAIEEGMELTTHLLNVLCGEGPNSLLSLVEKPLLFNQTLSLPTHLEADLLARRPDLMAQIWRVEAAAKEIGVAKTLFYPNIDLTAIGGLESLTFNKLFLWASKMGSLNPAVHLPIFTGGRLKANLRSKVAQFNEASFEYNQLVLKSVQEVADQLTTIRSVSEQLTVQEESLGNAAEKYSLHAMRFEGGIDDLLTVLSSEESVLNEELILIDIQRNKLITTLQLIKALGGGYESPLEPPRQEKSQLTQETSDD